MGGLVPKVKERLLTLYVACTVGMLRQGGCFEDSIQSKTCGPTLSVWEQRNVTPAQRMGTLPLKGKAGQLHKVGNLNKDGVVLFSPTGVHPSQKNGSLVTHPTMLVIIAPGASHPQVG